MGFILLLLFVGLPVIEIAVFISIGGAIGLWSTLAMIIVTAVAGAILVRKQGLTTLYSAQENLKNGSLPLKDIFDGLCLIVSGLFLITPGFVTDSLGFMLFLPQFRVVLKKFISSLLLTKTSARVYNNTKTEQPAQSSNTIIDGDFEEIYEQKSLKRETLDNITDEGKK